MFEDVNLHIERGDRIALVGPNGAGKSTLMRMLSQSETPDGGTLTLGHQVVMEYFAQDEAARLNPALTVYETLEAGSPNDMVPAIRNILGGFLFSGDDIHKKAGVLSGGERTRLAVARMLLRPSNTLLLDEPTNHLDLDSKDVLLEALEDYGGTLILVSHDRYFVEKLATKIIEIGHGEALGLSRHLHGISLEQERTRRAARRPTAAAASRAEKKSDGGPARQPRPPEGSGLRPRAQARLKAQAKSRKLRTRRSRTAKSGSGSRRSARRSSASRSRCASASPTSRARIASSEARSEAARGGHVGSRVSTRIPRDRSRSSIAIRR